MRRRYLASVSQIVGGQIGEGRHAGAGIAALQIRAQLLGGLFRHPRIHGEPGPFGRAARIFAVTGRAAVREHLLWEQLPGREQQ